MTAQFEKGQVVQLKSGGPKMTVENVGENAMTGEQAVWCVWFDGKKQMRDTFAPEALEPYVAGEPKRVSRVRSSGWQG